MTFSSPSGEILLMRKISVLMALSLVAIPAQAAIVTVAVTDPDPTAANGLEAAIQTVNSGDPDDIHIIEIDLDDGARTISITSELPPITQRAVIVRGTRTRAEGLYILTGEDADGRDAGTLLRMRRGDAQPDDALLYSIQNLVLEKSGIFCAIMEANAVSVVNSIFRECLQPGTPPSALQINGTGTIRDSDFLDNSAACGLGFCQGGAVSSEGGRLTIEASSFRNNRVNSGREPALGGAVRSLDGIEISDSYFADNTAVDASGEDALGDNPVAAGGAVYVRGTAFIYRSSFHRNEADGHDQGHGLGGAIFHQPETLNNGLSMRLWNVEFDSNRARGSGQGGAVMQESAGSETPQLDIRNSTFRNNLSSGTGADLVIDSAAADESINNTIFDSSQGEPSCVKNGSGSALNGNWNLLTSSSTCNVQGTTVNSIGFSGLISSGRLQVNDLSPDSPAIDAGNPAPSDFDTPATCRPSDSIGRERPRAGPDGAAAVCDIGALEFLRDRLFGDRFEG